MPRRIFQGVVVSDKMEKTIVVSVEKRVQHPIYKKYIFKTSKYHAHDPENRFKQGDHVRIIEGKPISKTKTWYALYNSESAAGEVTK